MKKSKIKQIPTYPTRYYDHDKGVWVDVTWQGKPVLSHIEYVGEVRYETDPTQQVPQCQRKIIPHTMIDNDPFHDTLIYEGYYRGRSAAGARFTNSKGQIFTVFMTDLDKFIPLMTKGRIEGWFIYCKRGQNYGVTLYTGD